VVVMWTVKGLKAHHSNICDPHFTEHSFGYICQCMAVMLIMVTDQNHNDHCKAQVFFPCSTLQFTSKRACSKYYNYVAFVRGVSYPDGSVECLNQLIMSMRWLYIKRTIYNGKHTRA
jgi:hypothetical protein